MGYRWLAVLGVSGWETVGYALPLFVCFRKLQVTFPGLGKAVVAAAIVIVFVVLAGAVIAPMFR